LRGPLVSGVAASNHQTREEDDGYGYFRQASCSYSYLGRVTLIDAGTPSRAKERYSLDALLTDRQLRFHEQSGKVVEKQRIAVGGAEAAVFVIGAAGRLDKQASVLWRLHAGRFVIDGQFNWMLPRKNMTEEYRKKTGIGLFPDALSLVKGVLDALDPAALSKR